MYLFDQTLASESGQIYVASSGSATITVELVAEAFVTKLKIYPTASFPSRFKVCWLNMFIFIDNYYTFYKSVEKQYCLYSTHGF